jgi:hypothetical protein
MSPGGDPSRWRRPPHPGDDVVSETTNHSCRASRTMAVDADIVLNTAADPARASAWMPDSERYEISAHPDEHLASEVEQNFNVS